MDSADRGGIERFGAERFFEKSMRKDYEVQQGDCMERIAYERGFFWETLWKRSKNAELKRKRRDPNALMEGDVLRPVL